MPTKILVLFIMNVLKVIRYLIFVVVKEIRILLSFFSYLPDLVFIKMLVQLVGKSNSQKTFVFTKLLYLFTFITKIKYDIF